MKVSLGGNFCMYPRRGGVGLVGLDLAETRLLREFEGRAELAAEEAAEGDILAKAVELGFSDEVCGDGSGGNGPETLYLLKRGAI